LCSRKYIDVVPAAVVDGPARARVPEPDRTVSTTCDSCDHQLSFSSARCYIAAGTKCASLRTACFKHAVVIAWPAYSNADQPIHRCGVRVKFPVAGGSWRRDRAHEAYGGLVSRHRYAWQRTMGCTAWAVGANWCDRHARAHAWFTDWRLRRDPQSSVQCMQPLTSAVLKNTKCTVRNLQTPLPSGPRTHAPLEYHRTPPPLVISRRAAACRLRRAGIPVVARVQPVVWPIVVDVGE